MWNLKQAITIVTLCVLSLPGCKRVTDLEGDYTLTATHSQMVAADISAMPDNAAISQQAAEEPIATDSVWAFEDLGNEHYLIRAKASGQAITAVSNPADNTVSLSLADANYTDAQQFRVITAALSDSSEYVLINKLTEKAMAVADGSTAAGAAIIAENFLLRAHQKWVISAYDPQLPDRQLVSEEDAWDVIAEAGEPYKGRNYQQDFSNPNIQAASPLDPRTVEPGTMIPGRVILDGKPLVEYYPGKLPFIAVCIHNKAKITKYMRENYPVGWRSCSGSCDSVKASIDFRDGKRGVTMGDSGSGELCKATVAYLEKITGQRPHMIVPNWPKGLMDMNRRPRNKVAHVTPPLRQHPELLATWDDFMSFVREARDIAYQDWGGGLQIGFHGQVSRSARNHFGTGITAGNLNVSEAVMNNPNSKQYKKIMSSSRLEYSLKQRKLSPWDAYKGQYSLGQGVAVRGIPTFPSATMKDQKGPFWSTGGSFERTSSSRDFQDKKIAGRPYPDHHPDHFDNVQLESYSNFMRGSRLNAYAAQLGEAIYDNLVHNLGFDIPRVRGGDGAMTGDELAAITTVAADCKGSPIKSTTNYRVGSHFHLPQACLKFCEETDGCNFVSMFVDPSPDPKNKKYRSTRKCFAYNSCEVVEKSDYNLYRL